MEFRSTIYLSKWTGITVSSTGASRKVHAPQLCRSYDGWQGILTSFLLLFQKHLEKRFNDCETSQNLSLPPGKGNLNPQAWSPVLVLQTLQWGAVIAADRNMSSSRQAGSAGQWWTHQVTNCPLRPDSYATGIKMYFPVQPREWRVEFACARMGHWMMEIQVTHWGHQVGHWKNLD